MTNSAAAKFNMIEQQIRPWEVLDHQVLDVLMNLNRADFVRDKYKGLAYADCRIPLDNQTSMCPPVVEGRMLQALLIQPDDQILEIGSGSGYLTACLASLGKQVLSLDISQENLDFASQNIDKAGLTNVEFKLDDGFKLDSPEAFDVIAVTGSVSTVPQNLKLALKPGGRMFVIVGHSPAMQALLIIRNAANEWVSQSLFETDLPALQS